MAPGSSAASVFPPHSQRPRAAAPDDVPARVPQGPTPVLFHGSLSVVYLLCHALALTLSPAYAKHISYGFLVVASLAASIACIFRSRRSSASLDWMALSLAVLLWSLGMATSLIQEAILATADSTAGLSMLLYVLYGVPLVFILASREHEPWRVRCLDAVQALALGSLFFVHTFSYATLSGASDAGVQKLRLMFDIENVFVAAFALISLIVTSSGERRRFLHTLTLFSSVYLVTAAYINHFQWGTDYGSLSDVVIGVPFLLLTARALSPEAPPRDVEISAQLEHIVRTGTPLIMPVALLIVSAVVLRAHEALASFGFTMATLGYGLRSVLTQVRSLEERDRYNRLALADPLTGVANRRQFDLALRRVWSRAAQHDEGLAVLLVDIDFFKRLNDTFGHPAGDRYLRSVAKALAGCAVPGVESVARYGGEEFAIVFSAPSVEAAFQFGETLRTAVATLNLPTPDPNARLTVSVGVGFVRPIGQRAPAHLLTAADAALYRSKENGRNRTHQQVL